jgi:hypothetical protein
MIGRVQVTQTIKPGVVTFTLGHGHWATGALSEEQDPRRIGKTGLGLKT